MMTPHSLLSARDWSALCCASGRAGHVPNAIASLTARNARERTDARFALDNEVVRQSDRYEAAAYLIAPLASQLKERPEFGRSEIYQVLIEIADGTDMPGTNVTLLSGSVVTLNEACKLEFNQYREIFESDSTDAEVGEFASELLESIQGMDEYD